VMGSERLWNGTAWKMETLWHEVQMRQWN